jgi:hypothetical protein
MRSIGSTGALMVAVKLDSEIVSPTMGSLSMVVFQVAVFATA